MFSAADVDAAATRLTGVARQTPLLHNERLTTAIGAQVWLKREDLQVGRSYKLRGAYNLLAQLDADERAAGAVCASAGNHGQGVAYACRQLGIHGRVHVPSTTPRQKRERIAALGGDAVELVVGGDTYDEAAAAASDYAVRTGATVVPAFDDPRTIAGQGTVGIEIVAAAGPRTGRRRGAGRRRRAARRSGRLVRSAPSGGPDRGCGARRRREHGGRAGRRRPDRAARAGLVRRRRRSAPGRRRELPAGARLRSRAQERPRGTRLHRDARPLPGRRHHRRTRRRAGHGCPRRARRRTTTTRSCVCCRVETTT